jgi:hypothetical protein
LTENTCERADLNLGMDGNDAALAPTAHDNVTTTLANFLETETLKSLHDFRPG